MIGVPRDISTDRAWTLVCLLAAAVSVHFYGGPVSGVDDDAKYLTELIAQGGDHRIFYNCRPLYMLALNIWPEIPFYFLISTAAMIAVVWLGGRAIHRATGSILASLVPAFALPAFPVLNEVAFQNDDNTVASAAICLLVWSLWRRRRSPALIGLAAGLAVSIHIETAPIAAVAVLFSGRVFKAWTVAAWVWIASYALFFSFVPGASLDGLVDALFGADSVRAGLTPLFYRITFWAGLKSYLLPPLDSALFASLALVGLGLRPGRNEAILAALFAAALLVPALGPGDPERWSNAATIALIGLGVCAGGWIKGLRLDLRTIAAAILIALFLISGVRSGTEKTRDAKAIELFEQLEKSTVQGPGSRVQGLGGTFLSRTTGGQR